MKAIAYVFAYWRWGVLGVAATAIYFGAVWLTDRIALANQADEYRIALAAEKKVAEHQVVDLRAVMKHDAMIQTQLLQLQQGVYNAVAVNPRCDFTSDFIGLRNGAAAMSAPDSGASSAASANRANAATHNVTARGRKAVPRRPR